MPPRAEAFGPLKSLLGPANIAQATNPTPAAKRNATFAMTQIRIRRTVIKVIDLERRSYRTPKVDLYKNQIRVSPTTQIQHELSITVLLRVGEWRRQLRVETISGLPNGHDQLRLRRIALQLAPELYHMNVDRASADALVISPHLPQQFLAR